ncbi:hypothetical protein J2Z21_007140 [Streptomyces griseochromogenes]|uniref:DUF4253 domain-containing protein n=1 Tax=Streptomyces griseochromogenes TaxID=68214 RepID=A0A1B1AQ85_9ACTN|nr:DUF4253 domain-containing protein [Streptomyces griseochromogenes]ANP48713.1 hypothetical protein AVL59_03215 [Streptomyces griseochromogenes]MBP2054138.1 hypothetical protein [Streptomyces griseochromogenes]
MATLPNPLPKLATDPSGRTLGLQLPPGRLIDATDDGPWHEPLLWHAEKQAAPGTWKALGAPAARAGLLPVLVDAGGAQGGVESWELMPGEMSYPGDHDAAELLAEYWDDVAEDELDEEAEPFGAQWPGLAPAASPTADPDTRAAQIADSLTDGTRARLKDPRLALVPARRSADIPAAIGWTGPLNYDNDVARLCTILRSWEDRFGIRVVALTFDTLTVAVAAPPATQAEAEAVAAEHFAFCPDNITQNCPDTLEAYAKGLIGEPAWSFWWD